MREVAAIIEAAVDIQQLARAITKEHTALQDDERNADAHERKSTSYRESAARRRVEIGRLLVEAKRGIRHGGWLPYLEKLGIDRQRASEWMRLAGHIEEQPKCPTSANGGHLAAPTLADAGIDKRPRKRDEQPDETRKSLPIDEAASRALDIDRELSRWHQKIVAFAEVVTPSARKQIANELRQMANAIETIKG